ncbi:MAG TPA: high-affinity nickel-transport family protein [Terriglobales bacterium]|jgi:high-affinity nickel-transport protein|nr:high-affinity nickel-transport family protein [Terriglobales bacterium]
MVNFFSIIALGFFLGMRHATDPDHVIAVSTIVSREREIGKSAWIGVFWGIGHTLTIFAVGAAIILFDVAISPRIGLSMELAVGLMLILLGIINVVSFFRDLPSSSERAGTPAPPQGSTAQTGTPDHLQTEMVHSHAHSHGDFIHTHPHSHAHGPDAHVHAGQNPVAWLDRMFLRFKLYRPMRPLMIGLVHGMAGSAAVALLVLATIRDPRWAVAYLLVFGVGTIAGMMVITMSIASTFRLAHGKQVFLQRLAMASGVLSLGFGIFVAYQIIVVNGLLSAHPQWVPR